MNAENANNPPIPVVIDQVANGYMVSAARTEDGDLNLLEAHVFPSKAALFAHLASHFNHECASVPMDEKPKGIVVSKAIFDEMQRAGAVGAITGAGFTDFNRRAT